MINWKKKYLSICKSQELISVVQRKANNFLTEYNEKCIFK